MERRFSRGRDIATNFAMLWWNDEFCDVAMERRISRLSRWSDEFRDVAMERCRDGATNFAMLQWNDVTMERRFSRCRDIATNFAMLQWNDEQRDVAMEQRVLG